MICFLCRERRFLAAASQAAEGGPSKSTSAAPEENSGGQEAQRVLMSERLLTANPSNPWGKRCRERS